MFPKKTEDILLFRLPKARHQHFRPQGPVKQSRRGVSRCQTSAEELCQFCEWCSEQWHVYDFGVLKSKKKHCILKTPAQCIKTNQFTCIYRCNNNRIENHFVYSILVKNERIAESMTSAKTQSTVLSAHTFPKWGRGLKMFLPFKLSGTVQIHD